MKMQSQMFRPCCTAEEILDVAATLPLESQRLVLLLAKGMADARACLVQRTEDGVQSPGDAEPERPFQGR